jgi:ElaB/YqjD/DUF883 family membrane-anchored ribosome-binding protein
VKEKREEIMNFLDKLERQMLDNISAIESKTRQHIEKLIKELSARLDPTSCRVCSRLSNAVDDTEVSSKSSIIIMSLQGILPPV